MNIVKEFEFPLSFLIEKAQKEINKLNGEIPEEDDLKFQYEELYKGLTSLCSQLREVEKYQLKLKQHLKEL